MTTTRQSIKKDYTGETIWVGIDTHLRSWTVMPLHDGVKRYKAFHTSPDPDKLLEHLERNYPGGTYICVYEAGFCGYWIQHRFTELGIECIVTHAADVPTTQKEKQLKDDKRDSIKLAKGLRSGELTEVYVCLLYTSPSPRDLSTSRMPSSA